MDKNIHMIQGPLQEAIKNRFIVCMDVCVVATNIQKTIRGTDKHNKHNLAITLPSASMTQQFSC